MLRDLAVFWGGTVTKPIPYSHSPQFSDHFAYHIVFLCCHMTVRLMSGFQPQRALHHMTFALHHVTVRLITVLRYTHTFSLFHSTPIKLFAYSFFGNILSTSLSSVSMFLYISLTNPSHSTTRSSLPHSQSHSSSIHYLTNRSHPTTLSLISTH